MTSGPWEGERGPAIGRLAGQSPATVFSIKKPPITDDQFYRCVFANLSFHITRHNVRLRSAPITVDVRLVLNVSICWNCL